VEAGGGTGKDERYHTVPFGKGRRCADGLGHDLLAMTQTRIIDASHAISVDGRHWRREKPLKTDRSVPVIRQVRKGRAYQQPCYSRGLIAIGQVRLRAGDGREWAGTLRSNAVSATDAADGSEKLRRLPQPA